MSTSCRLAVGAAKALENSAAPRIARRTFASASSKPISTSRTATYGSLRCLRETQRTGTEAGHAANGLRGQTRSFSQSASRSKLKTIDQIRARNKGGVCSSSYSDLRMDLGYQVGVITGLTTTAAIQPHSRHPLHRIRWRTMGLLHIREGAAGAEADSRPDKRHWKAQGWRAIRTGRPGWKSIFERRHARQILVGMQCSMSTLNLGVD
jgi:hypothetical protein